jgi:hypothetical protein
MKTTRISDPLVRFLFFERFKFRPILPPCVLATRRSCWSPPRGGRKTHPQTLQHNPLFFPGGSEHLPSAFSKKILVATSPLSPRERERETERGKYTQFDRDKSDTNRFIITHTRCPQNNHARKAHTHPRPTLLLAPRFARLDQSSFFPCFSVRCVALQALHIAGHPTTPTPPFFSVSNSTITIVVVVRQRRRLRRPPRPSSLIKLVVSPLGQASPASQSVPVLCL